MPGKGWDAACNRIVNLGEFKDNNTGKEIYLFNTHFDHLGETARQESAKLLLKSIKNIASNSAVIVSGDFNSTPNSVTYQILTQNSKSESEIRLFDTKLVSLNPHHGPDGTFTGFKLSALTEKSEPIDYILVTRNIKVINHGTLSDTFNGFFLQTICRFWLKLLSINEFILIQQRTEMLIF